MAPGICYRKSLLCVRKWVVHKTVAYILGFFSKNFVKQFVGLTLTRHTEKHMQSFKLKHCIRAERQRGNDLLSKSNASLSVCV